MATATINRQWQVANNGGWAETFNFYVGGAGASDDFTGCSATLSLIRPGRPKSEVLTYSSSDTPTYVAVSVSPAVVNIAIPGSVTLGWPPGLYDVQLRVTSPASTVDRYNLVGPARLTVIEAPGT